MVKNMKRPEQLIQQGVFSNLIPLMHLQKYTQFMAFQIRNETGVGGKQGSMLGAIAKSMGTMDGVSDTVFLFPAREQQEIVSHETSGNRIYMGTVTVEIPPKIVFVEFKAGKNKLSSSQAAFKGRVEDFGFEYRIVAAEDVNDALRQVYSLLRDNWVTV